MTFPGSPAQYIILGQAGDCDSNLSPGPAYLCRLVHQQEEARLKVEPALGDSVRDVLLRPSGCYVARLIRHPASPTLVFDLMQQAFYGLQSRSAVGLEVTAGLPEHGMLVLVSDHREPGPENAPTVEESEFLIAPLLLDALGDEAVEVGHEYRFGALT